MNKQPFHYLRQTIAPTIKTSLRLVNRQPQLIAAAILMSLLSLVGRAGNWSVLALILPLVLFGWGFVEVDLLHQAQRRQKIEWGSVPSLIGHYLKKTWPLIVVGLLFFFGLLPLTQSFLTQAAQQTYLLANNAIGWAVFVTLVDSLTTLISLWFVQSMVILVVKDQSIFGSLKAAGQDLLRQPAFFLVMALGLSLISFIARTFLQFSPFTVVTSLVYLVFIAYLNLVIKSIFLTNFLKR